MKKNLWMLLGLIAAIVLTGCTSQTYDLYERDWCYIFDFTQGQQGFLITAGSLTEQGITADATGLLQTSYGYNRDVYLNIVQITAVRPTGVVGDITVTAAGQVFGMATYFTSTMPADLSIAQLKFDLLPNGEQIIGEQRDVNITVDGSQPIAIESIFIGGMGASPVPHNLCDDSTPTPIVTVNGTGTPIPYTVTPTPTPTGTWASPTATPAPMICEFDFTIDKQGWDNVYPGEGYEDGVGWKLLANLMAIYRVIEGDGEVTAIDLFFNQDRSFLFTIATDVGLRYYDNQSGTGVHIDLSDNVVSQQIQMRWDGNSAADYSAWRLIGVKLYSTECGASEPATGTPGPTSTAATATPSPSPTAEPLWSACFDFTVSRYNFTATEAEYEDDLGWVQTVDPWAIGRNGLSAVPKKKFKLVFAENAEVAGSIRVTNGGATVTGWKLVYGPSGVVIVDFSDEAWVPTTNFWLEMDIGFRPYVLQQLCWLDPNPSTGTPIPGSTSTLATRTPLPTTTRTPAPSRTPVGIPLPPVIIITSTSGVPITSTPIYGGTGVYSATGTPYGTPSGDPSGGSGGPGNLGDVGSMVGFGLDIGFGLFGTMSAYLGQGNAIATGLLSAFINAKPQPIPGLPLCISNPMKHDICAIWYVMDNTIFAPATPGQYIVPLMQIIFNIIIALYFVRWILRLIWRGEQVTSVE